jgi:hypothetical protein
MDTGPTSSGPGVLAHPQFPWLRRVSQRSGPGHAGDRPIRRRGTARGEPVGARRNGRLPCRVPAIMTPVVSNGSPLAAPRRQLSGRLAAPRGGAAGRGCPLRRACGAAGRSMPEHERCEGFPAADRRWGAVTRRWRLSAVVLKTEHRDECSPGAERLGASRRPCPATARGCDGTAGRLPGRPADAKRLCPADRGRQTGGGQGPRVRFPTSPTFAPAH